MFDDKFFEQWLDNQAQKVMDMVANGQSISPEQMMVLVLKAQTNHFAHLDIELREDIQALDKRLSGEMQSMNERFGKEMQALRKDMDKRFEQVDKCFEQVLDAAHIRRRRHQHNLAFNEFNRFIKLPC